MIYLIFSYNVCRDICSDRGDYKEVFKYYILDNAKKHQVFTFISSKPDQFEQLVMDYLKVGFNCCK